jgi:hypothetical protein
MLDPKPEEQWVGPNSEEGLRRNPTPRVTTKDHLDQDEVRNYTGFGKLFMSCSISPFGGKSTAANLGRMLLAFIALLTVLCMAYAIFH